MFSDVPLFRFDWLFYGVIRRQCLGLGWILCLFRGARIVSKQKPYMGFKFIPVSPTIMLEPCKLYLDLEYCRRTGS